MTTDQRWTDDNMRLSQSDLSETNGDAAEDDVAGNWIQDNSIFIANCVFTPEVRQFLPSLLSIMKIVSSKADYSPKAARSDIDVALRLVMRWRR